MEKIYLRDGLHPEYAHILKKNLNIKLFEQALYKIYISITSKLMKRYSTSLVIKEMQLKLRQAPKPGHVEQGNRDG